MDLLIMASNEFESIRDFLEEKYLLYNNRSFIENDPICVPHAFSKKEDKEIAAFLTATIAWGNRKSIIANATKLMALMDNAPYDFITNFKARELGPFDHFVHRTFNGKDCRFFLESLQYLYKHKNGLEGAFGKLDLQAGFPLKNNLVQFRNLFLETKHMKRTEKHISDPSRKSSAKRLCMFLRWMVRKDRKNVDFGLWKNIPASQLCLPLDVHTGNISRRLGLLTRKQNDWQAVEEITSVLRLMDPKDPVKYDFALFGSGIDKALD
jgi:uncharacterized protein (TIGR02757 family)